MYRERGISWVNPVSRTYVRGFGALPLLGVQNIHPRVHAGGVLWYGVKGFTLIEILVTVALIGIISAIAIPDWGTVLLTFRLKGGARQVQADLDWAKWRAIHENANYELIFSATNNNYTIGRVDDPTRTKTLPNGITVQTDEEIEYSVIGKRVGGSGTITVKLCNTKNEGRNLKVNTRGRIRLCTPSSCGLEDC